MAKAKIQTKQLDTSSYDDNARVIQNAKTFWEKYSKPIVYIFGGLTAILLGYIAYTNFYAAPREQKAADAIWQAQEYYNMDSLNLALKGDGQFPGFEKVIRDYSGTKAGNLAKFYAGSVSLRQGDFKKAEEYLKGFNTSSKTVQAVAWSRLGDALAEQGKSAEAITLYAKAGHHFPENQALSSENLFKAGLLSEVQGKNDEAIKYYKEIKDKYSRTQRGFQISKYLARLGSID